MRTPTTTPDATAAPAGWEAPTGPLWILRDAATEAERHLRIVPRNIELLIFAAVQPVMFLLLFRYVFGGSISVPGFDSYTQFLVPGVMAQTVLFGSAFTGIGLAEDMHKGLVERLRSLPMSRSAVLLGRTLSDLVRNLFSFATMLVAAFAVGFRFEGSLLDALVASAVLLGFSYAFSWIQALIGLSLSSVEAVNSAGFIWMFPLTFVSSAFVDPATMPGPLRAFADHNPFTVATDACRALYNGADPGGDLWQAIAWIVGITIVFAAASIRRFTRAVR
ncbi:MAG: ABC transporter permease [Actinomyces sp.]|nr:MAG: ABC transporter permease [Actinomyces sp.]